MVLVGFCCFFCWDFILFENILVMLSNWVNDFLINDKVSKIVKIIGDKLCDVCKREGEEDEVK